MRLQLGEQHVQRGLEALRSLCASLQPSVVGRQGQGGALQARILSIVAQDDTCEVASRPWRPGYMNDAPGIRMQSMLAIKPSSFSSDVAPNWLVTEAASYSQLEHKLARAQAGGHHGGAIQGKSKGGKSKGKNKKKVEAGLYSELIGRQPLKYRDLIERESLFLCPVI